MLPHLLDGPCRIDPFGEGPQTGCLRCGCGHNRRSPPCPDDRRRDCRALGPRPDVAQTLLLAADDKSSDYGIKIKRSSAGSLKFTILRPINGISAILAGRGSRFAQEFGRYKGQPCHGADSSGPADQAVGGFGDFCRDRSTVRLVESMHRTTMGVDTEYKHLIRKGCAQL